MGFAISVTAFQGLDRAQVMERARLAEGPGRRRERWWLGEIDGWTILWGEYGYATPKRLAAFSQGARVVGWELEEHVMVSSAAEFRDGVRVWVMAHDPETDVAGVDVAGEPPAGFAAALAELEREQQEFDERGGLPVDTMFDAPFEAARLVTGYRHDEVYPEDDPRFVAVHVTAYDGLEDDAPREPRSARRAPKPPLRPLLPEEIWPMRLARLAVVQALVIAALGVTSLMISAWDPTAIVIGLALVGAGCLAARHVWRRGSLLSVVLLGLPSLTMAMIGLAGAFARWPPLDFSNWTYLLAAISAVAIYGAVRLDDIRRDLHLD